MKNDSINLKNINIKTNNKKVEEPIINLSIQCKECGNPLEDCPYKEVRNLNDFKMQYCKEYLHVIKYQKRR